MRQVAWLAVLVAACAAGGTGSSDRATQLARIALLADMRSSGEGELEQLAAHVDPRVRERAVQALGRLPWPEEGAATTRALLERLFDPEASVRAQAAFALGLRGDPSAGDKLAFVALDFHEADRDPLVRARAVEALSKLSRPDLHERLLDALDDSDPRVRLEAAQGASRWPTSAGVVDQRLIRHLALDPDESVRIYALFALDRRKSAAALETFLRFSDATAPEQRIYSARGLRHSIEAPAALEAAVKALADSDARVAYEAALTLGQSRSTKAFDALAEATKRENAHVRRGAWEALNTWRQSLEHRNQLRPVVEKLPLQLASQWLAAENSSGVRIAMLATLFPLGEQLVRLDEPNLDFDDSTLSFADIERLVHGERDWIGVAQGLARCRHPESVKVLALMAKLEPLAVREAALEALAGHKSEAARAVLLEQLGDPDNGVRLASVLALAEMLQPGDIEAFERCFESASGDGTPEVRFNIVKLLPALGGPAAKELARRALFDEHAFVRRTAREAFARLAAGDSDLEEQLERSLAHRTADELATRAVAADAPPSHAGANPRVKIVTSRGTMVFELFPEEAPRHVASFSALIARDYYDGLDFHRVVPDFVIQGGCYRGDGNGGGTWRGRGDALEHEISPRKYVRGSLGMPRWDDVDSGGSQFFVTHRATPHLDGRYTIFGELREGFDVLDAIDIGDQIVDVELVSE